LFNEVGQERLTRLDRSLVARSKDGILVVSAEQEQDPLQRSLRIGRLKTLERLGLAEERQQGVWALDAKTETKLRQLGERADKFKMMQRALKEAGVDRAAAAMAPFERGPRKVPLIGQVIGVGMVDAGRAAAVADPPNPNAALNQFVGPAGEVFDRALAEVGLERERLYVTNAVKHFKFEERGKRRIHQTPRANELAACRPWLDAELAAIKPEILVCLGATAARAIFGAGFRIMKDRGRFAATRWAPKTIATLHPSAVLRGEDPAQEAKLYQMLVEDLRLVATA